MHLDEQDKQLILATQSGLPLSVTPYADLATQLRLSEQEVLQRLQAMQDKGIIRRIAVVPNHYRIGYRYNAMSVWDVDDHLADELGTKVGQLAAVSHCYLRPRYRPEWPYNLFAMLHGQQQQDVEIHVQHIQQILGTYCHSHELLYSERILKKTGLRLQPNRS